MSRGNTHPGSPFTNFSPCILPFLISGSCPLTALSWIRCSASWLGVWDRWGVEILGITWRWKSNAKRNQVLESILQTQETEERLSDEDLTRINCLPRCRRGIASRSRVAEIHTGRLRKCAKINTRIFRSIQTRCTVCLHGELFWTRGRVQSTPPFNVDQRTGVDHIAVYTFNK